MSMLCVHMCVHRARACVCSSVCVHVGPCFPLAFVLYHTHTYTCMHSNECMHARTHTGELFCVGNATTLFQAGVRHPQTVSHPHLCMRAYTRIQSNTRVHKFKVHDHTHNSRKHTHAHSGKADSARTWTRSLVGLRPLLMHTATWRCVQKCVGPMKTACERDVDCSIGPAAFTGILTHVLFCARRTSKLRPEFLGRTPRAHPL